MRIVPYTKGQDAHKTIAAKVMDSIPAVWLGKSLTGVANGTPIPQRLWAIGNLNHPLKTIENVTLSGFRFIILRSQINYQLRFC